MVSRQILTDDAIRLELEEAVGIESTQFADDFRYIVDRTIIWDVIFLDATAVTVATAYSLIGWIVIIDIQTIVTFSVTGIAWFTFFGRGCGCCGDRTRFNQIYWILYILSQF